MGSQAYLSLPDMGVSSKKERPRHRMRRRSSRLTPWLVTWNAPHSLQARRRELVGADKSMLGMLREEF